MVNYQRWITLSYLGLGAVAWLLIRQIADLVWNLGRLPLPEEWPLSPTEIIALVAAFVTFLLLQRNGRVNAFANEVAVELGKVTWAPRKETVVSTGVIAVMVGICAVLLFLMDIVWGTFVKLLYS